MANDDDLRFFVQAQGFDVDCFKVTVRIYDAAATQEAIVIQKNANETAKQAGCSRGKEAISLRTGCCNSKLNDSLL